MKCSLLSRPMTCAHDWISRVVFPGDAVVDATAGVAALRGFIRAFRMGSSAIIGTRPTAEDDYTLAYSPRKSDTTFRL